VLIRVVNPAYPESVMLVILFMNVMAPVIDYGFVQANIRRRLARRALKLDISTRYTVAFAAAVCVVCALLVSVAAVSLQPRQEGQRALYMEKNVLLAAGLVEPGSQGQPQRDRPHLPRHPVRLVDLATGELVPRPSIDARRYDQRAARNDPATSREAPPNDAGIRRLPKLRGRLLRHEGRPPVDQIVIAVEGLGMWGTIYGFLALDPDGNTVRGLTYYDQTRNAGPGRRDRQPEAGRRCGAAARPSTTTGSAASP
jgi:Na(+)-translocating NADH:ubiquinone oxidoreductase C subunit